MTNTEEPGAKPAKYITSLRSFLTHGLGWSKYVSPIGVLILVLYYLNLNFTPDITIAQGAIVAAQAGTVGVLMMWAAAAIFSSPGWIYIAAVDPHSLPEKSRKTTLKALIRRSMLVQISTFSVILAICYWPTNTGYADSFIGPFFTLLAVPSIAALVRSPLAITTNGIEHRPVFWITIIAGVFAAIVSMLTIWAVQTNVAKSPENEVRFILTLFILAALSPVHLVFSFKERLAHLITAFVIVAEVLITLGAQTTPFFLVARAVGVAEPKPVMLAMPAALCQMIASSGNNIASSCGTNKDGPALIGPAQVFNSLGSRWLIRDLKSSATFNIPGKDIVIARTAVPSATGNH